MEDKEYKDVNPFYCEEADGDNVNHPKHYCNKSDGIETIKIVDHMVLGLKPRAAVRIGNATKYMDRFMGKNGAEDLKKAIWYLQDYVDHYEEYNESDANGAGCNNG